MSGSTFLLILIIAALVSIGIFVYIALKESQKRDELRERGVVVSAKVVDRRQVVRYYRTTDGTYVYYISYEYNVGGSRYSRGERVSRSTYHSMQEGQLIEVVYLPESPAVARIARTL